MSTARAPATVDPLARTHLRTLPLARAAASLSAARQRPEDFDPDVFADADEDAAPAAAAATVVARPDPSPGVGTGAATDVFDSDSDSDAASDSDSDSSSDSESTGISSDDDNVVLSSIAPTVTHARSVATFKAPTREPADIAVRESFHNTTAHQLHRSASYSFTQQHQAPASNSPASALLANGHSHQPQVKSRPSRLHLRHRQSKSWLGSILDSVLELVDPLTDAYTPAALNSIIPDRQRRASPPHSSRNFLTRSHTDTFTATTDLSPPDYHYARGAEYRAADNAVLAVSEFTLAATLGPEPHPAAMQALIDMHADPALDTYNATRAIEWTQLRMMVLATPEGMLAQARFLRGVRTNGRVFHSPGGGSADGRDNDAVDCSDEWDLDDRDDLEASLLIRRAKDAGYPPALLAYGVFLRQTGHWTEAIEWFTRAYDEHVWEAAEWIVDSYLRGCKPLNFPVNLELAAEWRAKLELKREFSKREEEERQRKDEEDSRRYREEADARAFEKHRADMAKKRELQAAKERREKDGTYVSTLRLLSWGYHTLAVDELCALARSGNPMAQELMDPDLSPIPRDKPYYAATAFAFAEYFSKRVDTARAAKWYRNASELGHADAQIAYATHLASGKGLSTADPGQAVAWLMKAWAHSKHKEAAMALGDAFTRGIGVAPDASKAMLWYMRAWERGGFMEAAFAVAVAFATGFTPGFARTDTVVVHDGRGLMSSRDRPVARDFEKALYYYEQAASFGHERACNNLGEMYMLGRGGPRNEFMGLHYFRRAAEKGLPQAMYNVGRCFRDGRGCARDEPTAMVWFERALEYGVQDAAQAIKESPLARSPAPATAPAV